MQKVGIPPRSLLSPAGTPSFCCRDQCGITSVWSNAALEVRSRPNIPGSIPDAALSRPFRTSMSFSAHLSCLFRRGSECNVRVWNGGRFTCLFWGTVGPAMTPQPSVRVGLGQVCAAQVIVQYLIFNLEVGMSIICYWSFIIDYLYTRMYCNSKIKKYWRTLRRRGTSPK